MKLKAVVMHGLAVAALVALQASTAAAVTFNYSQSTGFERGSEILEAGFPVSPAAAMSGVEFFDPNPAIVVGPPDGPPPPNTYSTIAWGCNLAGASCAAPGDNEVFADPRLNPARSGLLADGVAGTVDVNGDWVDITHLEHTNNPITGRTLARVDIESILRISTNPLTEDENTITIGFKETLNQAPCAPPNPRGSICDDFFTFDLTGFAPLIITDNGTQYLVEFRIDPASLVNATFLPSPDGSTGVVYTAEGVTSELDVQMRIVQIVPEPATLMLLGAGLIGVGFAAAKRRRKI